MILYVDIPPSPPPPPKKKESRCYVKIVKEKLCH